jgi:mRNA interferase RelE/StbE
VSYRVEFTRLAEKDLGRLSKSDGKTAMHAITTMRDDPKKGYTLKGTLKGARSLEFSLHGGAYRAAYYVITEDERCLVFMVGSHERFYEEAERRAAALIKLGLVKKP